MATNNSKTAVIITLAGASSRFSKSLGYAAHKSIYTDNKHASILERQIRGIQAYLPNSDIYLVTGYMHQDVQKALKQMVGIPNAITVTQNTEWDKYGSAHSLYLGLKAVVDSNIRYDKVLFFEGDLIFNFKVFEKFSKSYDAVGYVNKLIDSKVDVVGIARQSDRTLGELTISYAYSPDHTVLSFTGCAGIKHLFASAQIWQWRYAIVKANMWMLNGYQKTDNNLFIVNRLMKYHNPELIQIRNWHNCNTIQEWKKI